MIEVISIILALVTAYLISRVISYGSKISTQRDEIRDLRNEINSSLTKGMLEKQNTKVNHKNEIEEARKDAVKRSKSIKNGFVIENFAPMAEQFPADPKEVRFYGDPIDYIALTDQWDEEKCCVKIIEVKSGNAQLTKNQRNIKNAVIAGRVEFIEYRVNQLGEVKVKTYKPKSK